MRKTSPTKENWELVIDFTEIKNSGIKLDDLLSSILAIERRSEKTYKNI